MRVLYSIHKCDVFTQKFFIIRIATKTNTKVFAVKLKHRNDIKTAFVIKSQVCAVAAAV